MADQNINNMSVTWNAGGTTFSAVKINVTDTASAAASLLQDFQVGGAVKWTVKKNGDIYAAGAATIVGALTCTATEVFAGMLLVPTDKTYKLVVKAPFAGTITEATVISLSGTCTATFKINTTALGGTASSVSSVEQSQAHASANAFVAGDDIQVTISANAACLDMSFSLKYTRATL